MFFPMQMLFRYVWVFFFFSNLIELSVGIWLCYLKEWRLPHISSLFCIYLEFREIFRFSVNLDCNPIATLAKISLWKWGYLSLIFPVSKIKFTKLFWLLLVSLKYYKIFTNLSSDTTFQYLRLAVSDKQQLVTAAVITFSWENWQSMLTQEENISQKESNIQVTMALYIAVVIILFKYRNSIRIWMACFAHLTIIFFKKDDNPLW